MPVTDEQIEAAAISDATFDGRTFSALGRADKQRYRDRSRAALEAALALTGQPVGPDWCFDPEHWDYTCEWKDRDLLTDDLPFGGVMKIATVASLPPKWAAHVAKTFDADGDPDETEVRWFDTEAEAIAARSALPTPPGTHTEEGGE